MKRTFLHAFASLLSICSVSSAAIIIDDFSANQARQGLVSGSINTGIFSVSAIGGARNISLDIVTQNAPNESSTAVSNGTLDLSNAIGMASLLTVVWDGGIDNTLNPNGFLPVDLTEGGQNDIIRIATSGDFALNSTITLWSGNGNFATWNFILPSSVSVSNVDLAFAAPTSTAGAFDISAITSVRLIVNGVTNADRSIDFVSAESTVGPSEVPEPASIALVGLGAIATAMLSRRRQSVSSEKL